MSPPDHVGLRAGDVLTRRYLLLERIAWGGMSVIWRAFDQSLQRMVAVKMLDGELGVDRGERELIRREARATARLIHPDAIEVYDYGESVTSHGRLAAYVVMRLLEGRPLADRITEGPLPWAEAATIAARLATVLAAAHERGIVHRDVTAENVLLTSAGAKLLDFGIAAFIGEDDDDRASDYGTPPYVAPERLTGAVADPANDVYALGVLLFEMLTGDHPYPERTWEEIENVRREGPPPVAEVPGMPARISALCQVCLSHRPEARPKAQEVADGLAAALNPPAPTVAPASATVPARSIGGNELVRWTVVATVVALFAGLLVWNQLSGSPGFPGFPGSSGGQMAGPQGRGTVPPTVLDPTTAHPEPSPSVTVTVTRKQGKHAAEPAPGVEAIRSYDPNLNQSVRRFNAVLAKGEDEGRIRSDVALDLRQVFANSVWDSRDLTPIRGKIAERNREGTLPDDFRHALETQLLHVSIALTG
ncbi:serine/threonine-protein kinase [Streptosporangium sp. NBC_01469]|uniref:serine/threonine-protein kinase n=1 Tax=Streptosporangium sp. NBC_01469 TaxID=2903898 RepID=UPI002E286714|nr:serine/threonine-protein kinase [Streptosporangium sp. NBC_01469]